MIELIFYFGTDIIYVRINGNDIRFANSEYVNFEAPIEGLKLNYDGVVKEYPDLKDTPMWKLEAIARFKMKIADMKDEEEIAKYIISDLKKYGYIPKWKQKKGFRREVIK